MEQNWDFQYIISLFFNMWTLSDLELCRLYILPCIISINSKSEKKKNLPENGYLQHIYSYP